MADESPMIALTAVATRVGAHFPQWFLASHDYRGDATLIIRREGVRAICQFLRDERDLVFSFLMDLTCVDYQTFGHSQGSAPTMITPSPLPYFMKPALTAERWDRLPVPTPSGAKAHPAGEEATRFEVVYHLHSLEHNRRVRLKVPVPESDPVVESVTGVWPAADWFEREVWDMFGIRFTGHPNLKRILMYDPFEGHPLRKDYPVNRRQPLIGPVN